jgi:hypothetical protein
MEQREERYVLEGQVPVDDAYLGGERTGGKVGRGSENKVPFVAAVSFNEEGHPLRAKLTLVPGFTLLPPIMFRPPERTWEEAVRWQRVSREGGCRV